MGKANRARRKAKEKNRRQRRQQQGSADQARQQGAFFWTPHPHQSPGGAELVELVVDDAINAALKDDVEAFAECVMALTAPTGRAGRHTSAGLPAQVVDAALARVMNKSVTLGWRLG